MRKKRRFRRIPILLVGACCLLGFTLFGEEHLITKIEDLQSSSFDSAKFSYMNKELHSRNAILLDVESEEILLQKRSNEKIYPASLTKIMTVYIALQRIDDLNVKLRVPREFIQELMEMDASMAGFDLDGEVSAMDLLYGAMLPSGADACVTLGEHIAGTQEEFVEEMNATAKQLHMKNTHFMNVTGLHDEQHYSTVSDLMLLLKEAIKIPMFQTIFTTQSYQGEASAMHPNGILLTSTLSTSLTRFGIQNDYILGAKTGYTPEAGLCMASLGSVAQNTLLFVSAGASGDHDTQPYHIIDALRIYQEVNTEKP